MIGLIIATVAIIAVALLRVGVTAEYSDSGAEIIGRIGFLKMKLYPQKKKSRRTAAKDGRKKREKSDSKRSRRKKDKDEQETGKKPGLAFDFKRVFNEAKKVLVKLKRRLLIKELTVLFVQAGGDPYKMATRQGTVLAALGLTQGALESFFRVKRYNLHSSVDFIAEEPKIYVKATLSIAVWEIISVGVAVLMLILRAKKNPAAANAEVEKTSPEVKNKKQQNENNSE